MQNLLIINHFLLVITTTLTIIIWEFVYTLELLKLIKLLIYNYILVCALVVLLIWLLLRLLDI